MIGSRKPGQSNPVSLRTGLEVEILKGFGSVGAPGGGSTDCEVTSVKEERVQPR